MQEKLQTLAEAPFDLAKGPLLRVLIAAEEFSVVMAACAHHIAVDLHSVVILMREVEQAYLQLISRGHVEMPPPRAQHHDYVVAQRERQERALGELPARAEVLRLHPLQTGSTLRALPAGAPLARRIHRTVRAHYRRALIDKSKELSVTPYAWVLAAAQTLVARLERVEELSAVTPTTGRRSTALLEAVGYFVNLVPVPCRFERAQTFAETVVASSRRAKEAFAARELPFPLLVAAASGGSASSPRPGLAVTYERPADRRSTSLIGGAVGREISYLDCPAQVLELPRPAPQADLAIAVIDDGTELSVCFDIDRRVYDDAHGDAVADAFVALLEATLRDSSIAVGKLPLLDERGRAAVLALGEEPAPSSRPTHETLHAGVLATAAKLPNVVAIAHGGVALTYRELVERAGRVAAALRDRGVAQGRPVAVWMEPGVDLVTAALAIMMAGGAYMPVDISLPYARVTRMLADAAPALVLVDGDREVDEAPTARLDELTGAEVFLDATVRGEDAAYVIFTSGSTGRPKGVVCTHRGACNLLDEARRLAPIPVGQGAAAFCSVAFDVSIYELFSALCAGATLRFVPSELRADAEALVAWLRDEYIASAFVPAMALPALLSLAQEARPSLRRLLVGVEPIPHSLLRALATACPDMVIINGYGPTETAICATFWVDRGGPVIEGRAAPIGRPIPGTGAYLVDGGGELLPVGAIGELVLTGRGLAQGYLADPEMTARRFVTFEGPARSERAYKTGDLARFNADRTISFVGRADGQVKLRGHRIERGEIETVIREQPGVIECYVNVWHDIPGGRLVAHLAASDAAAVEAARERASELLPAYMVPSQWVVVEALPRSSNGKVDPSRLELPRRAEVQRAPADPLTEAVAAQFGEVLGISVGPDDDFFSLGGHSLLASQLVARLRSRHSVELPLASLWQAPTPRGMATRIAAAAPLLPADPAAGANRSTWPLTPAQRRMWMHEQITPGTRAYTMTDAIRLSGQLDVEALRAALAGVVERHATLRSVVRARGEELLAVVQFAPAVELPVIELAELALVDDLVNQLAAPAFDLANGPLFRFALAKLGPDDHVLCTCVHHIACDGWSLGVLARDIFELYAGNALWPLPVTYGDLAARQVAADTDERRAAAANFWRPRLTGLPTVELGRDGAGARDQAVRASVTIDSEVLARLAPLARQTQATPFMALVAVVQLWLSRVSGGTDIVIGAPFADRSSPESEPLVGLLLDTLVLRAEVSGARSFLELLASARDEVVAALDYRDAPVEEILAEVDGRARGAGAAPFDVLVNFISVPPLASSAAGLELVRLPPVVTAPKFPLTIYAVLSDAGLELELVAQAEVFSAARLAASGRQLVCLLDELTAHPRRRSDEASMIDAVAAQIVPDPRTALALEHVGFVHERILAQPAGDVALRWSGGELTYGELAARSAQVAAAISATGLPQGTAVGIHSSRCPGAVVAMVGVLRAGYVMVMIDEGLPQKRRERLCESAAVRVGLAIGAEPLAVADVTWIAMSTDGVVDAAPAADFAAVSDPDAPAYVFFTSGTTGTPKPVLGTQRGLAHFVGWQVGRFGIGAGDRAAHLTSLGFDVVLRDVLTPLSGGATLCVPDGTLDPSTLLPWLDEQRITLMHTVPTLLNWWLDHGDAKLGLRSLRWIFSAGEALHSSLVQRWQRTFPSARTTFVNIYGPTETTMAKMFNVVETVTPGNQPVGRPLPQTQALVLRDGRVRCGLGEVGEIWIRTPYRTRGYLHDPQETARKFVQNPFTDDPSDLIYRTGDLGRYRPDGLLEVLGRIDHQVKIGGVRIEPDEIAGVLTRMPGVRRAAVVAVTKPDGVKALVAYVVGDDTVALTCAGMTAQVAAELPPAMIPSRFLFLADLPTNANGKLDRRALPEPDWSAEAVETVAPATETEVRLAALWSELLGGRTIGVHDNFFASGGHSLLAMRLMARVAGELGVEIALRDFFDDPTVAAMARLVERGALVAHPHTIEQDAAAIAALRDAPLTELQAAYLFGRRSDVAMGGVPTHGYAEIDFPGVDVVAMERALATVVARHDALRLRFGDDRQELAAAADTTVALHDWRALGPADVAARLAALRAEMIGQPLPADRAPLVRLAVSHALTDDGASIDRVHVVFDALILDAGSSRILATELLDAYHGRELPPAPAAGRFLSYVRGLAEAEHSAELAAARQYWMDRLATLPDGPELPLAVDIAQISNAQFTRTTATLPADKWQRFRERAAAAGVTPTSALLAAYAQVVAAYARRPQFCVNVTTSRRPGHPDDAGVLGNFTSLLLVEVDGGAGGSVAESLRAVHAQLWRDLSASAFSGVRVMREIARQGRPPAMPVVFTSALGDSRGAALPEPSYGVTRSSQVVLNHGVSEVDGALQLRWDVVAEAFRPGVAEEMLELLRHTLAELAELEWGAVRFDALVGRAAAAFDRAHNQTEGTRPSRTMHAPIIDQCKATPERLALVGPHVEMTYGELAARAGAVATFLREVGAAPGDRVALLMKKGPEQAIAALGVLGCRCAYIPVDPTQPAARIREIFEQIQPVAVLTQSRFAAHEAIGELPSRAVDAMTPVPGVELAAGELSDLAYVIFTSGSTGRPKGVAIDQRGAANTVLDINERYQVTADDRTLAISSLSFDLSVYDLFGFLSIGGAVVVPDAERERDAEHLAECVATYGVTVWNSVPAFLEMVVEQTADRPEQLSSIRLAMLSGDWIPLRLVDRTRALQPQITLMSLGGATEASIWSNDFPIGAIEPGWKSVPYGRPLRNQTMHVLDAAGRPRPAWAVGELFIGGIGVALGYWGDEQRTKERFVDHPELGRIYRTGDLGRRWRDGIIELLGRDDLQVKIRGHRIELGEVEAALRGGPGVKEAVCAVRGERGGHLVAYVLRDEAATGEAELAQAILAHVSAKVPEYMVPSRVMFIDALPLSSNGKVDRRRLPEPSAEHHSGGAAPTTEAERKLAAIWMEVLRVGEIVTSDDFLSLGGDSIRAVQVVARARRAGLHLEVRALLERRCLGELAARSGAPCAQAVVLPDVASASPTPIQRWFLDNEFAEQDHWNQSIAVELDASVTVEDVRQAMAQLEARHVGLRLRFVRHAGAWQQTVAPAEVTTASLHQLSVAAMSSEAARLASNLHADRLHKSLSLESGPVWGALLIDAGAQAPRRLVVVAHHLVVDGISWRVLLEDLDTVLRGGELMPLSTGFVAWAARRAEHLAEHRDAAQEALAEVESWPWDLVQPLPVDDAGAHNRVASAARALVRIDAGTTAKLLERGAVRREANMEAILVAAVVKALRRWTGHEAFALHLESHGRDVAEALGVDISRTVGWFTRLAPVVLEVGDDSLDETIDDIAAQLRARRLGALAEELWHRGADRPGVVPEVSFDYLGHADGVLASGARLRWAGQAPGQTRSSAAHRRDLLEIIAHVGNGQLEVAITYGDRHRPATMSVLASAIERELRSLTASRIDVAETDHVVDRYPLAPLQEVMLDGQSRRAGTYHVQWLVPLVGDLDPAALGRAWQRMVGRHAILRTALRDADGQPRQVELAAAEAAVTVYDGREAMEDVRALVAHDRSTPFDLEVPPLARLAVILGPSQRHHLLFSHHHGILDGWSEPRLFSELFACYDAEREGKTLELTPVPSQRGFVDWLYNHSRPNEGKDTVARRMRRRTLAPLARGEEPAGVAAAVLSAEPLTRAARRFRVTPSAVASLAWAAALGAARGEVAIGLASSVRPAEVPDIESILGCFLNVAPLPCHELGKLTIEEALAELQARQLRAVEGAHRPLAESCRAVGLSPSAIDSVLRFQSYDFAVPLPQSLRSWRGLPRLERCDFEAFDVWHYPLNLVIIPERELTIQLDFDPARISAALAQRLVRRLCAAITALPELSGTFAALDAVLAHHGGERLVIGAGGFHAGTSLTASAELRGPEED